MKSIWRCVVCGKKFRSSSAVLAHCGKLTEWVRFDDPVSKKRVEERREVRERISVPMVSKSGAVKINVSGYIIMDRKEYDKIVQSDDPYYMMQIALKMGMVSLDNLSFESEE